MNKGMDMYTQSLALTIISSVYIAVAALIALWILLDIVQRKGWMTMTAIIQASPVLSLKDSEITTLISNFFDRIPVYALKLL